MTIHPNGNMNMHYKIAWSKISGNLISSKPQTHLLVVEIFQSGPKWQTSWLSDITVHRAINTGRVKNKNSNILFSFGALKIYTLMLSRQQGQVSRNSVASITNDMLRHEKTAFFAEILFQQFDNKSLFVMKVCLQ